MQDEASDVLDAAEAAEDIAQTEIQAGNRAQNNIQGGSAVGGRSVVDSFIGRK